MMIDVNDIVGKRYGKLLVTKFIKSKPPDAHSTNYRHIYQVKCDCGVIEAVNRYTIKNKHKKQCSQCTKLNHTKQFTPTKGLMGIGRGLVYRGFRGRK